MLLLFVRLPPMPPSAIVCWRISCCLSLSMTPHSRLLFVFNTLFTIILLISLVALVLGHGFNHAKVHHHTRTIRQRHTNSIYVPVNRTTNRLLGYSTSGNAAAPVGAALAPCGTFYSNRQKLSLPNILSLLKSMICYSDLLFFDWNSISREIV